MRLFGRKPTSPPPQRIAGQNAKERVGIYSSYTHWFDERTGTWRIIYEKTVQPTPGAMSYAYASLGIPGFAVCGRATAIRGGVPSPLQASAPEVGPFFERQVRVTGLPTTAGTFQRTPLS